METRRDPSSPTATSGSREGDPEGERAHFAAELARAQRLAHAAHQARAAAELARDLAERTRDAMERADDSIRRQHAGLLEQVAFFEEQMRSTRLFLAEFVQSELVILRAQNEDLLHDVNLLSQELRERERGDGLLGRSASGAVGSHPVSTRGAGQHKPDPSERATLRLIPSDGSKDEAPRPR
jgi:hypothetical protein